MKKQKIIKRITIIISIAIILLLSICFTDYWRTTHAFEQPIFARLVNGADDGGSGTYIGIGYSIEIEGNFMPQDELKGVTHTRFFVLGNEVKYAIRD
mgnify:CR=1 FL=1